MGILIEHFAGAFPLWLAPEQVRVLPISDKVAEYARACAGTAARGRVPGDASTCGREDRGQDPRRPAREDSGDARRRRQGGRDPDGLVPRSGRRRPRARCRFCRRLNGWLPSAPAARPGKRRRRCRRLWRWMMRRKITRIDRDVPTEGRIQPGHGRFAARPGAPGRSCWAVWD